MGDTKKAGRELDAEVAEKVMGLVPCQSVFHHEKGHQWACFAKPETPTMGGELLSYSTDISAAWEVVEKMRPFVAGRVSIDATRDWVEVGIGLSEDQQGRGKARTFPLAICLASLDAISQAPCKAALASLSTDNTRVASTETRE